MNIILRILDAYKLFLLYTKKERKRNKIEETC